MRTDHSWFKERLGTTWRSQPGRSCLLVVPPGCDSLVVANEVVAWSTNADQIWFPNETRRVAVARIVVDTASSSTHFVRRFGRELGRSIAAVAQIPEDSYAADWMENIVGAAQAGGVHPILVIDRFHAFASIADDHLLSVLSTMRQLEHDSQMTTVAVSRMNYRTIRARLSERGKFPFVNSAYGDNHDQIVMPPLSRTEFVSAAVAAGLNDAQGQSLFAQAGGPDCVHEAIIKVASTGAIDIVDRAVRMLGDSLEVFFDMAISPRVEDRNDLMLRVATGQLLPAQIAYLRHLDLSKFLLKETRNGQTMVSSPVLGQLLLHGREGPWIAYAKVLEAIGDRRFGDAGRQVSLLARDHPHLEAFAGLVTMLAAVHDSELGGLLEIDWKTIRRVGRQLLAGNLPIGGQRAWVEQLVRWSGRVGDAVDTGRGRGARLDLLVRHAQDQDVRKLIEYALRVFLGRARRIGSPAERLRAGGSVPEAILQSLSAYLGLDPLNVPHKLPDLDYQRYFGNPGRYRRPEVGSQLDLTHLLVIVPALLDHKCAEFRDEIRICDPAFVRPLHQRLVVQARNTTAHTYAEMDEVAAKFFLDTCDALLDDATAVWAREDTDTISEEPNRQALADLLSGRDLQY